MHRESVKTVAKVVFLSDGKALEGE